MFSKIPMRFLTLFFLLVAAAAAQDLTGTWKLVSAGEWRPNGERADLYGKSPSGQLMYDGKGQVSMQVQNDGTGYQAHFGTYKVDAPNGTVYHVVRGSTAEKLRGTTVTYFVTLDGDRLTLGLLPEMVDGEMRLRSMVWERVR
ncbi:MAG: lipocalin-like domain-containing protein [Bryobacterales bacterium]|nr:lipocalin-like domain-containing protein [Bryobacterales bacterium]